MSQIAGEGVWGLTLVGLGALQLIAVWGCMRSLSDGWARYFQLRSWLSILSSGLWALVLWALASTDDRTLGCIFFFVMWMSSLSVVVRLHSAGRAVTVDVHDAHDIPGGG